jgi:hypothetical protein
MGFVPGPGDGGIGGTPASMAHQRRWLLVLCLPVIVVPVILWAVVGPGTGSYASAIGLVLFIIVLRLLFYSTVSGLLGTFSRKVADSLTGFNNPVEPWHPPIGSVPPSQPGEGHSPYSQTHIAAVGTLHPVARDWSVFVHGLSAGLGAALGPAYSVEAHDYVVKLSAGGELQRVALAGLLSPPPLAEQDLAVRATIRLLDEAQRFVERECRARWPQRDSAAGGRGSGGTVEPFALVDGAQLDWGWRDQLGVLMPLAPVLFVDSTAG